jgi:hypothetical protein
MDPLKVAVGKLVVFTGELTDDPLQDPEHMRIGNEIFSALIGNVSISAALK